MVLNTHGKEVWGVDSALCTNDVAEKLQRIRQLYPNDDITVPFGSHGVSSGDHYIPYKINNKFKAIRRRSDLANNDDLINEEVRFGSMDGVTVLNFHDFVVHQLPEIYNRLSHVILSCCFGRNDYGLLYTFKLDPVKSFITEES